MLLLGVVQPGHEAGHSSFRVLNLVRAVHLDVAVPRMPEELPPVITSRVSHGLRERL
jgi:hypothetical protein